MSLGQKIFEDLETFSDLECKLFGVYSHRNNIVRFIEYNQLINQKSIDGYKGQIEKLRIENEKLQEMNERLHEEMKVMKEDINELRERLDKIKKKKCGKCGEIGHNKATCPKKSP